MLIDVEVPGLAAAFTVTPRFACAPVTIKTENLSAGADRFEWDLITPNNSVETTTITEPEWTLTSPGVYTIRHRAGVIGDATTVEATPIVLEVYESPFAQFEIFLNQAVYIGTEVRVTNGTLGADTFSWNFGDHPESENKIDFQPAYAYASEGNYDITLTASKDYGPKDQDGDGVSDGNVVCVSKAVRPIFVRPGGSLKIPNAFTPNESNSEGGVPGDGTTNDFFLPIMDGVEEFTMQIFDRWGTLVFESREKNKGWNGYDRNGRIMPAGVYVYKIVLRLTDNSRTTKIGDVTLIR
jgi:gliding motility-associated-like protein